VKRVSLLAMAALPGLAGGVFAAVTPAAAATAPPSHRSHGVHPDSAQVCVQSLSDCTFVNGTGVHVTRVGVQEWTRAGTGNIGYDAPGYPVKSKWRTHAFAYNSSVFYHYYWSGIHCSFPAGTHIYGWANYYKITKPYVEIRGSSFTDLHNCA
jgi:hypothetical protein